MRKELELKEFSLCLHIIYPIQKIYATTQIDYPAANF